MASPTIIAMRLPPNVAVVSAPSQLPAGPAPAVVVTPQPRQYGQLQ